MDSDVGPRRRSRHSGRLTPRVDAGTPAGEPLNDAESAKWTEMHQARTRKWRRFTSEGPFSSGSLGLIWRHSARGSGGRLSVIRALWPESGGELGVGLLRTG